MHRRRHKTAERSDDGVVRSRNRWFWGVDSKSLFRGLHEVKIQQKITFWKAESLSFSVSKELECENASIARYKRFESDHFVVRRLRRRAFGVKITHFIKFIKFMRRQNVRVKLCFSVFYWVLLGFSVLIEVLDFIVMGNLRLQSHFCESSASIQAALPIHEMAEWG